MKEEWREVADGYYEVSNRGRVRRAKPGKGTYVGRPIKLALNGNVTCQYFAWFASCGQTRKWMKVHQAVAECFIGPCPEGLEVNHKDANRLNNVPGNLEYVTHLENIRHAIRLGLRGPILHSPIPEATVVEIRRLRKGGMTYTDLAKTTGVSRGHCQKIVSRTARRIPHES